MCNAQAMYAVRSRAQPHLHAHVPNSALLTTHDRFGSVMSFTITCKTVKMISFPTAISDVFHEPMSFRFNKRIRSAAALATMRLVLLLGCTLRGAKVYERNVGFYQKDHEATQSECGGDEVTAT